ncbi:MAG: pyridoxal phosphate-dependent aminotransferase [Acidobacteriota bacterium]
MTPQISNRARQMPASPIRKLMPFADDAKRRGVHVYHLNIGQPDIETPAVMRAKLEHIDKVLAYTPSGGTSEYLAALQTYYRRQIGVELTPNELIATTGGSEAILFAIFAATNDGDDILTVEPYYTNYNSFATLAGARIVALTAKGEDGFHLPPRTEWERALTPRTKAVILCNPNNPTGTVYTRDEVVMAAEFCRDHGLFLIADEVYREFVYDGRTVTSTLTLRGFEDIVIVVDSLSKRYSACGIRLGCIATRNRDLHQACLRMAQGRLSPPGLAQLLATGMNEVPPDYTTTVVEEYQSRRDLLFAGLSAIPGVFLREPEGAFYFVARLPVLDAEDFARWLLSEFSFEGKTVMVAPAAGFYATKGLGYNEVRIAYVLKRSDLEQAVRVFAAALDAYRKVRNLQDLPVDAGARPAESPRFSPPNV